MKKFIVENDFWNIFPNARIGIITCIGIDNSMKDKDKYRDMIYSAENEALKFLKNEDFSSNEVIKIWRDAFRKFKTKKGARSSIEALLKRVYNGNHLGTINPLVDIYNSISLRYGLPCGGEDSDSFIGDIRLTKAIGDENFITLGTDKNMPPYEGEIVYKDNEGVICRCWNWRESIRTMLTENTKNAFLCIKLIDERRLNELRDILNDLSRVIQNNLGGTCTISILDINNKEIFIK